MPEPAANVLLVDDRQENLLVLEAILGPLGHDLVTATSGQEALKRLLNQHFAVILLDVQMPGLDGFQTAELIRQRERTRHVPIIFLTALDRASNRCCAATRWELSTTCTSPSIRRSCASRSRSSSSSSTAT